MFSFSPVLLRWDADHCPVLFQFWHSALRRLIRREFLSDELPSLIEEILPYKDVDDMIRRLPKDNAQTFIDVMDEARYSSTHHDVAIQRNWD